MGYLFSVKNNQVYCNQEAIGNTKNPSYFGVNNFIDGDLSLPATKENIGAVSNASSFNFLHMDSPSMLGICKSEIIRSISEWFLIRS